MTICWIFYKFAWLRRLNEAKLERYLENKLIGEQRDLNQERIRTLNLLEHEVRASGPLQIPLRLWANILIVSVFFSRVLRFGRTKFPIRRAMLHLRIGDKEGAREIFNDIARSALRTAELYDRQLEAKRLEARNALLYSGRIAVLLDEREEASRAFKAVLGIKDDPEARKLRNL